MNSRARIATISLAGRIFPTREANRENVLALLDSALARRADLVCLPETFATANMSGTAKELAESVPGPTVDAVAARARRHGCYIVCPLLTLRDGRVYNSAVILDRSGAIAGIYDKQQPVTCNADYTILERGVTPGAGEGIFDLDFGRVGIAICFDVGFPEAWANLARQGARLVLWPSAYDGGLPLAAYAVLHQFYVVTSTWERSRIIDPCGNLLTATNNLLNVATGDINLDYAVCHYNFNHALPDRILSAYPGRVEVRAQDDAGTFLLEPTDPALTIARLKQEFGFETAPEYHQRHRVAYGRLRDGQTPQPQQAAHGERPLHAK